MMIPDHSLLTQEPKPMPLEVQRATLRERLQRRFEVWLDEALNPEAVPQGLSADILEQLDTDITNDMSVSSADEDLQSVCAALVGLTETAKHQGGALEQLHQDLPAVQALAEQVSILLDSLVADRKKQEERQKLEARKQVFQEILGLVIDMRDQLTTGQKQAQSQLAILVQNTIAPKHRWWHKLTKAKPSQDTIQARSALESVIKANQLGISSLNQSLAQWQVTVIEAVGEPVDLNTMKVVDQAPSDKSPGTVLKVLRAGYTWNGTLCRQAEVCVAQSTAE